MTSTASTLAAVEGIGPLLSGLFLCAEPDEAFFSSTVFKFGSNPVETPCNLAAIIGVFVTVKGFQEEHPLISAKVNGLCRRWIGHEWAACGFLEWLVL